MVKSLQCLKNLLFGTNKRKIFSCLGLAITFFLIGTLIIPVYNKQDGFDNILDTITGNDDRFIGLGDESNDSEAFFYEYFTPPSNSFGMGATVFKTPNWSFWQNKFQNHFYKQALYKRYSYSGWQDGSSYVSISKDWNESGNFWKINITLDVPVDVYEVNISFGCDLPVLDYVERDGFEIWINYSANATEVYSVSFNYSDIANIQGVSTSRYRVGNVWAISFHRNNVPSGVYVFDPYFGSIIGVGQASIENNIISGKFQMDAVSGTAESITAKIYINEQPHKIKCAIYNCVDDSFVAMTEEIDCAVVYGAEKTFSFSGSPILNASGWYNLSIWGEGTTGECFCYRSASGGNGMGSKYDTYDGNYPDPLINSNNYANYLVYIRCNYLPSNCYEGGIADGYAAIQGSDDWGTARTGSTAQSVSTSNQYYNTPAVSVNGEDPDPIVYDIFRSFLIFNTSGIDDGATIEHAYLHVCPYSQNTSSVMVVRSDWGSSLDTGDWDSVNIEGPTDYVDSPVTSWDNGVYTNITLNSNFIDDINKAGNTTLALVNYEFDYTGTEPQPRESGTNGMYFSDSPGNFPYLEIMTTSANNPPTVNSGGNETPVNGSFLFEPEPSLGIYVFDTNGDTMTCDWYTANPGDFEKDVWTWRQTNMSGNGVICFDAGSGFNDTLYWKVTVNDGNGENVSSDWFVYTVNGYFPYCALYYNGTDLVGASGGHDDGSFCFNTPPETAFNMDEETATSIYCGDYMLVGFNNTDYISLNTSADFRIRNIYYHLWSPNATVFYGDSHTVFFNKTYNTIIAPWDTENVSLDWELDHITIVPAVIPDYSTMVNLTTPSLINVSSDFLSWTSVNALNQTFTIMHDNAPFIVSNRSIASWVIVNVPDSIWNGTDNITDSDGDGLTDHEELVYHFTNPFLNDTDNDTASDYQEIVIDNTDPNNYTDFEPIYQTNENPTDASIGVNINTEELNVTIHCTIPAASLDWTIYSDIGSNSGSGNTTGDIINVNVSGNLSASTTYYWWVNVTDGSNWAREVYSFTTELGWVNISYIYGVYTNITSFQNISYIYGIYTNTTTFNNISYIYGIYHNTTIYYNSSYVFGFYTNNTNWNNNSYIYGTYSNNTNWNNISYIYGIYSNSTTWKQQGSTITGTYTNNTNWINNSFKHGFYANNTNWLNQSYITGTYSNQSIWYVEQTDINGTYINSTSWINESYIYGIYNNNSNWNAINTINGIYTNTSIYINESYVTGTYINTTIYHQQGNTITSTYNNITSYINQSYISGIYNNQTNFINNSYIIGIYINSSIWTIIQTDINGIYQNATKWFNNSYTNGTYNNQTNWNNLSYKYGIYSNSTNWIDTDTISGTYTNSSIWAIIQSGINGVYSNQTSWNNQSFITGTYSNNSIWTTITTISGTYINITNYINESYISGTYSNSSIWSIIQSGINGIYSNITSWINESYIYGIYNNNSNWNAISTINGIYINNSIWTSITTISGTYTNITTIWYNIITITGSYTNTSIIPPIIISNIYPSDKSWNIPLQSTIYATINSTTGQNMNISWYYGLINGSENILIGTNTNFINSTQYELFLQSIDKATRYYIRIQADDGNNYINETFDFKTEGYNIQLKENNYALPMAIGACALLLVIIFVLRRRKEY